MGRLQPSAVEWLDESTVNDMAQKSFVHIGCGPKNKLQTTRVFAEDTWTEIRFDIDPRAKPDIVGSMLDMSMIPSGTIDAVFSSHNIEHLYPHEVPVAMAEFRRILRPDGYVVITCPDLQGIAELVAQDKLVDAAYHSPAGPITPLDVIYGYRPAMAAGNLFMAHRCGFTRRVLEGTLREAGFISTATSRRGGPAFDLWALATVTQIDDERLKALALSHFPA